MSTSSRRWGCCLVVFVITSALYISQPSLFSNIIKGFNLVHNAPSSCSPCTCDCPPPLSIMQIAPGLVNLSLTDCGKDDPELNKEMEKQFVDRLTEELKLQKAVAEENIRHMNVTYMSAKRLASQYEREAEKCNAATETCEQARERVEALLIKERKRTLAWEKRARKLGWVVS